MGVHNLGTFQACTGWVYALRRWWGVGDCLRMCRISLHYWRVLKTVRDGTGQVYTLLEVDGSFQDDAGGYTVLKSSGDDLGRFRMGLHSPGGQLGHTIGLRRMGLVVPDRDVNQQVKGWCETQKKTLIFVQVQQVTAGGGGPPDSAVGPGLKETPQPGPLPPRPSKLGLVSQTFRPAQSVTVFPYSAQSGFCLSYLEHFRLNCCQ